MNQILKAGQGSTNIAQQYHAEQHQGHLNNGTFRFKYNSKPLVPYVGPHVFYDESKLRAIEEQLAIAGKEQKEEQQEESITRSVAIQTMFRESYAQTDPYTPEYILPPPTPGGTQLYPEILTLSSFKNGVGLPVTVKEIELIERARAKREWEKTLPTGTDPISFEKRLRMMEKMEIKEWKEREKEIAEVQEARLQILQKIIESREKENEKINEQRIEKAWTRKLQERDQLLFKLERKKEKELRRLEAVRKKVDSKSRVKDAIDKYAKVSSELKSKALGVQKTTELVEYDTDKGLSNLEQRFQDVIEKIDIEIPKSIAEKKDPEARKTVQYQKVLQNIWEQSQLKSAKASEEDSPLRFMVEVIKAPVRAATPAIETRDRASIVIQTLLRGTSVANTIRGGVYRRRDLIEELRCKYELQREKEHKPSLLDQLPALKESSPAYLAHKPEALHHRVALGPDDPADRAIEANITSEYLGKLFDYYTKQLVVLREEKKLFAFVQMAERTRRLKEAEERGRRQEELKRREFEDQVFKQVMQVNDETIDTYLAGILAESQEATAQAKAHEATVLYAKQVNEWIDSLEQKHSEDPESIQSTVQDLVLSFLIPEVEREMSRQLFEQNQKKYLIAARTALETSVGDRLAEEQDKVGSEMEKMLSSMTVDERRQSMLLRNKEDSTKQLAGRRSLMGSRESVADGSRSDMAQ